LLLAVAAVEGGVAVFVIVDSFAWAGFVFRQGRRKNGEDRPLQRGT
jgi:hypothetical protein